MEDGFHLLLRITGLEREQAFELRIPILLCNEYALVLLEKLARKFGDVKFLQIDSEECIPGYPERNLPTLLMYRDDDLLRQCTGPSAFGGSSFGIDSVEWELAQAGIVETELKARPSVEAPFGSPVSKP